MGFGNRFKGIKRVVADIQKMFGHVLSICVLFHAEKRNEKEKEKGEGQEKDERMGHGHEQHLRFQTSTKKSKKTEKTEKTCKDSTGTGA